MIDKHLDTPVSKPGPIRTFTGYLVDPFNLKPEDIHIKDIAHSLAQTCRFTGHTRRFYSVGEHSLLVASLLRYHPAIVQLGGLVHDGAEAYFGDMAGPVKHREVMKAYDDAEHIAGAMIMQKFCGQLSFIDTLAIKKADADAYHVERPALMRPGPGEEYEHNFSSLGQQSMEAIERQFLDKFHNLCDQLALAGQLI